MDRVRNRIMVSIEIKTTVGVKVGLGLSQFAKLSLQLYINK